MTRRIVPVCLLVLLFASLNPAADSGKKSPKEGLQALNDLIGSWRGTGEPAGTREERQRNFWQEKISWEWQFKEGDVHLRAAIDRGKHFTAAELRYLPEADRYRLTLTTPARERLDFEGPREGRRLTLERRDERKKEVQRVVLSLLHFNRHLFRYEVRPADRPTFREVFRVGATKEGVEFAGGDDAPECVVSGGLGTMPVVYKGKTYYVCCSGCRDAFRDEPEKYIKEYEARKREKKKKNP